MTIAKKIASSFLLFLMTMNVIGHYSFLVLLRNQSKAITIDKIHSTINEPGGDLIFKLPMAIPYNTDFEEYQPVGNQYFNYEGKEYQIIKQKYYKDTLYVVCIYDQRTTESNNTISDYVKTFANDSQQKQGNNIKLITPIVEYYISVAHHIQQVCRGWSIGFVHGEHIVSYFYNSCFSAFHPPQFS